MTQAFGDHQLAQVREVERDATRRMISGVMDVCEREIEKLFPRHDKGVNCKEVHEENYGDGSTNTSKLLLSEIKKYDYIAQLSSDRFWYFSLNLMLHVGQCDYSAPSFFALMHKIRLWHTLLM